MESDVKSDLESKLRFGDSNEHTTESSIGSSLYYTVYTPAGVARKSAITKELKYDETSHWHDMACNLSDRVNEGMKEQDGRVSFRAREWTREKNEHRTEWASHCVENGVK